MNKQKIGKRKNENPLHELFGALKFHEPTKAILKELRKNELIEKNINELDKKIKSSATKRFLER